MIAAPLWGGITLRSTCIILRKVKTSAQLLLKSRHMYNYAGKTSGRRFALQGWICSAFLNCSTRNRYFKVSMFIITVRLSCLLLFFFVFRTRRFSCLSCHAPLCEAAILPLKRSQHYRIFESASGEESRKFLPLFSVDPGRIRGFICDDAPSRRKFVCFPGPGHEGERQTDSRFKCQPSSADLLPCSRHR